MRVGVVGGGVVGLATAWYLKRMGADPFVVESRTAGSGCSLGNGGWVCPSISSPVASPALTLGSLLRLLRPGSPLYIRPAALPRLAPWLLRFRAHCTRAAFDHGLRAMASLNMHTMERYEELTDNGVAFEFARSGILMAYRSPAKAMAARSEVEAVAALGVARCAVLGRDDLYEREPLLRPGFSGGLFVDSDAHARPESLTAGLARALRDAGVELHEGVSVLGFATADDTVRALVTGEGPMEADAVVLTAGAETGFLARAAGRAIPLTAGKGYSVTIDEPRNQLRQSLLLGEDKIVMTPFAGALRFGGTMELSGVNCRMDPRRLRAVRRGVARWVDVPEAATGGVEWVGMRPMAPDTLPVIGRLPARTNVYVNTGHQMSGVTLAPSTGRALAQEMLEGRSEVDLSPFSPSRFRRPTWRAWGPTDGRPADADAGGKPLGRRGPGS